MDRLIVFSSKYGSAKKSAEYLNTKLHGSIVMDLKQNEPNIGPFRIVVIGGSVYRGKLCGTVKRFLAKNQDQLKLKKIFIYINGITAQSFREVIGRDIPQSLRESAQIVFACGILPESVSLIDRFRFMSVQSRIKGLPKFEIDYTALDQLADKITQENQD